MKKVLFGFLLGLAVGAGGLWYFQQEQSRGSLERAKDSVVSSAGKVKEAVRETVGEIKAEEVRKELEHTGMIVREKAGKAGTALADTASNARITATIKAKLFTEPGVSAMHINVDTTDGLVTLSGTAASHEEVAKAVRLALETDGVRKVVSTLQVKAAK